MDYSDLAMRMVSEPDLDAFMEHLQVVQAQSGQDGDPIFTPFAIDAPADYEKMRERRLAGWAVPVGEVGWRRAWAAFDGDLVVGDVELEGGGIPSELHRASLGMGLQRAYRGRGLGTRMMEMTIAWARAQGLVYLDLGVFAGNEPAERLYAGLGFQRTGVRSDAFRVGGHRLDDIQMVLAL